jgi:hypothetical protein
LNAGRRIEMMGCAIDSLSRASATDFLGNAA